MTENETLKNRLAELSKQNTILADHLANMCCQADEDTPSEYRTEHFRSTMDDAYEYLEKIKYFMRDKWSVDNFLTEYCENEEGD